MNSIHLNWGSEQELLSDIIRSIHSDRQKQMKERTSEYFQREISDSEFMHIATTRMTLNVHQTGTPFENWNELFLDGKCIATWSDKILTKIEDGKIKITAG